MKRNIMLGSLLGVLASIGALLALMVTPAARAAVTFADPVGDGMPDITAVDVFDNGTGTAWITVAAPGITASDGYLAVFFDTDHNTGNGPEYLFELWPGHVFAYQWTHGGWTEIASPQMSTSSVGDAYTVAFSHSVLGGATSFEFYVEANAWDGIPDFAPSNTEWFSYAMTMPPAPAPAALEPWQQVGALVSILGTGQTYVLGQDGFWHYVDAETFAALGYSSSSILWFGEVPGSIGDPIPHQSPPVTTTSVPRATESVAVVEPAIGKAVAKPAAVLAGRHVVVTFPVTDANTGGAVTAVTMMSSNPKINGTIVKHVEHFANGFATVTLKVPKAATGKKLSVALTIKTTDGSASRIATFHIL
jgi:hypothetical protein